MGAPLKPTADSALINPDTIVEVGGEPIGIVGVDIGDKTKGSSTPLDLGSSP